MRSSGGASILLQNYVNHSHIAIHANLQAVAFRLTLHTNITLCSIYIPHSFAVTYQDLDKLVGQLPLPYILMGTFNSHSPLWGGRHLDTKGERIEKLISVKDLQYVLDLGHGTFCATDLTVCDPKLLMYFSWHVLDDLCGSDHFPLIITLTEVDTQQSPQKCQLKKANRYAFQTLCHGRFNEKPRDQEDLIKWFTSTLTTIADETKSAFVLKRQNPSGLMSNVKSLLRHGKSSKKVQ